MNSLWLIIGSLAAFAVAYRLYGAFLATKVAMIDDRLSRPRID
jgi:carbon starvation protein CstA